MDKDFKCWVVKRKVAVVMDIIQSKTSFSETSRSFDLLPSEVEDWVEEGKRGLENSLRAKGTGHQRAVRTAAQRDAGGVRRSDVGVACQRKVELPAGRRRDVIETVSRDWNRMWSELRWQSCVVGSMC